MAMLYKIQHQLTFKSTLSCEIKLNHDDQGPLHNVIIGTHSMITVQQPVLVQSRTPTHNAHVYYVAGNYLQQYQWNSMQAADKIIIIYYEINVFMKHINSQRPAAGTLNLGIYCVHCMIYSCIDLTTAAQVLHNKNKAEAEPTS